MESKYGDVKGTYNDTSSMYLIRLIPLPEDFCVTLTMPS